MSDKLSLAMQRQHTEHCLALLESLTGKEHQEHIQGARQGCLSLAWFERRSELTRELVRLEQEAPELAKLFQAEPGLKITDVRTCRTDFDGSIEEPDE
jgi:hypothetical protein